MDCALYRHFDAGGTLLYVGISLSPVARLSEHSAGSHWSRQIAYLTIEWHSSREAALRAERTAIQAEFPAFNRVHQIGSPAPKWTARRPRLFKRAHGWLCRVDGDQTGGTADTPRAAYESWLQWERSGFHQSAAVALVVDD